MQRVFRSALSLGEQLFLPRRHFSVTNLTFTWNHIKYSQYLDLGHQAFRAFAVDTLIDKYPHLSVSELDDVASGLTYDNHIFWKLKDVELLQTAETSNDILAKIGELIRKHDDEALNKIFEEFRNTCLSSLSAEDTSNLIKSQHPRFFLRHFCDLAEINLQTTTIRQSNGLYLTSIFFGNELVATAKHEKESEAEHLACLSTIKMRFLEPFYDVDLADIDQIPLECDVDIGKGHRQREVNIVKSSEEKFGFTIRGGQQKIIKNKEYMQLNIITPILVTTVKDGSPAQVAGLKKGDILLAVNDHAMSNKTHEQAVIALKKFENSEEISLTVIYNKHETLKYEAEQKILERELVRTKEELKSENYKRWHQSKSKIDPMDYFLSKFADKKRKFQPKNSKRSLRLWHEY